jgi:DNA-binding PadR family transcriptional regulator
MPLPDVTTLQLAVLKCLIDGNELPGRELRKRLEESQVAIKRPAFYRLMARLEDAKFVSGSYSQKAVGDQLVTERKYKITGEGCRAWNDAIDFFGAGVFAHA